MSSSVTSFLGGALGSVRFLGIFLLALRDFSVAHCVTSIVLIIVAYFVSSVIFGSMKCDFCDVFGGTVCHFCYLYCANTVIFSWSTL